MNLTMLQIRCFIALTQEGTFGRAASVLHMSQPSISRHIKGLEDSLGARLFDRDTRSVSLNSVGAAILPVCERLVSGVEADLAELIDIAKGKAGHVSIALLPSIGNKLLPQIIGPFREICPGVEIRAIDGMMTDVEDAVRQGRADFGFTMEPTEKAGLRYINLFDDPLVVLIQKDDPFAGHAAVTWKDIAERKFIALHKGTSIRHLTDLGFLKVGRSVKPAYECSYVRTAATFVSSGMGVTAIPQVNLPDAMNDFLVSKIIEDPIVYRFSGIITSQEKSTSKTSSIFIDIAREVARSQT
jgi:LysR family transcriptional regulator, carnitine catabolism transcriptional activator